MTGSTINNLSAHISWLLREKPFTPPAPTASHINLPDPAPAIDLGISNISLGNQAIDEAYPLQSSQSTQGVTRKTQAGSTSRAAGGHSTDLGNDSGGENAVLRDLTLVSAPKMARLRTQPGTIVQSHMQITPSDVASHHAAGELNLTEVCRIATVHGRKRKSEEISHGDFKRAGTTIKHVRNPSFDFQAIEDLEVSEGLLDEPPPSYSSATKHDTNHALQELQPDGPHVEANRTSQPLFPLPKATSDLGEKENLPNFGGYLYNGTGSQPLSQESRVPRQMVERGDTHHDMVADSEEDEVHIADAAGDSEVRKTSRRQVLRPEFTLNAHDNNGDSFHPPQQPRHHTSENRRSALPSQASGSEGRNIAWLATEDFAHRSKIAEVKQESLLDEYMNQIEQHGRATQQLEDDIEKSAKLVKSLHALKETWRRYGETKAKHADVRRALPLIVATRDAQQIQQKTSELHQVYQSLRAMEQDVDESLKSASLFEAAVLHAVTSEASKQSLPAESIMDGPRAPIQRSTSLQSPSEKSETKFAVYEQGSNATKPAVRQAQGFVHSTIRPTDLRLPAADDTPPFLEDQSDFVVCMGTPPGHQSPGEEFDDFAVDDENEFLTIVDNVEASQHEIQSMEHTMNFPPATAQGKVEPLPKSSQARRDVVPTGSPASKYAGHHFAWYKDVKSVLKDTFRLRGFRPNQLEAINATLDGKDVFVLMPTGGGKSLCYQLPSMVSSGRTKGVTIVVSPLLSLMQDQVEHLHELDVAAAFINSDCTQEQRSSVFSALQEERVEEFIQILYVTPEMLNKSQAALRAFESLYRRQRLARIVIDEAHCVSQWGHDFRPDYKLLGDVRQRFQGVPVMALTATATENVKMDVIHNLHMSGCESFKQSFNRPNLIYHVSRKSKGAAGLTEIAEIINGKYKGMSGIVYCLSRKKCESVAQQLREKYSIKAQHYHAGMDSAQRTNVQKQWQAGRYKVIVATIAFGMGIDKADVRFVIHHSLPKTLEGYYQETGRAGRDGKQSGCYLFYSFSDVVTMRRMIDDGEGSWEQKERLHRMLKQMYQYCDNQTDCRRAQVLNYFGETFAKASCHSTCDNCASDIQYEAQDLTQFATSAISIVRQVQSNKVTLLHCVDIMRGAKGKKISDLGHNAIDEYGAGKSLDRLDIQRIFEKLACDGALSVINVVDGRSGFVHEHIELGPRSRAYESQRERFRLEMRTSSHAGRVNFAPAGKSAKGAKKTKTSEATGVIAAQRNIPQSTNVSSPVGRFNHPATNQKQKDTRKGRVQPQPLEDSDGDDAFGPIPTESGADSNIGAPITADVIMGYLSPRHRCIVEDFMEHGKTMSRSVARQHSLKSVPFSDTVLQQMILRQTSTKEEMYAIPGINTAMVDKFGSKFMQLVKRAQEHRDVTMTGENHGDVAGPASAPGEEEKPFDPNHNVIDLVSEDDEYGDANSDDSFGDGGLDDEDLDTSSSYFAVPSSNTVGQARSKPAPSRSKATASAATSRSKKYNTGLSLEEQDLKRKTYFRGGRRSGGSRRSGGASSGGAKARRSSGKSKQASGATSSRAQRGGYGSGVRGGGSRATGIGMMPC